MESMTTISQQSYVLNCKQQMTTMRREVLKVFKQLHRTRLKTFAGDDYALEAARKQINEEYVKYKNISNEASIVELNKYASEVECELRTAVIRIVEKKEGVYEAQITPDTALLDNAQAQEGVSGSTKSQKSTKPKK